MILIRYFLILLPLISLSAIANSRSPAVEDFVGIEVEENQVAPRGTESLFNLEQDVQDIQNQSVTKYSGSSTVERETAFNFSDLTTTLTVGLVVGLPFIIWLLLMLNLKKRASLESASNIEILEKYRKEREDNQRQEEENKKAS